MSLSAATLNRKPVLKVGVDGVGKTTFADKIAVVLASHGRHVIRSSVDGFHNPDPCVTNLARHRRKGVSWTRLLRSLLRAARIARAGRDTYCISHQRVEDRIMSITLHRWGNSVGLRLPKSLLEQLGLGEGSQVDLKVDGNRLVIEPVRHRRLTMAELLEGFSPDDRPEEVDWGPPVGREVW